MREVELHIAQRKVEEAEVEGIVEAAAEMDKSEEDKQPPELGCSKILKLASMSPTTSQRNTNNYDGSTIGDNKFVANRH